MREERRERKEGEIRCYLALQSQEHCHKLSKKAFVKLFWRNLKQEEIREEREVRIVGTKIVVQSHDSLRRSATPTPAYQHGRG